MKSIDQRSLAACGSSGFSLRQRLLLRLRRTSTCSFELFDLSQKLNVDFRGVLRQPADAEADGLQGRGHHLLPPLKGAISTETTTGRMEFRREVE